MKSLKRSTAFLLSFLFLTACRSQSETAVTGSPSLETLISSTPPFQTKEPERYRATRTITIVTPAGETTVTKSLIAKDGELRRTDEETSKLVYLEIPEGKFVLSPDQKAYADLANETSTSSSKSDEESEVSPELLLHHDGNNSTSYQSLGTEVIDGRNANKYRVVVNSAGPGSVSLSETLIWVDEALNMPFKSETTAANGSRVTMQFTEISTEVDKGLFQIPDNYEKVTFNELRKRLKND